MLHRDGAEILLCTQVTEVTPRLTYPVVDIPTLLLYEEHRNEF
jgi:hypothetical protein